MSVSYPKISLPKDLEKKLEQCRQLPTIPSVAVKIIDISNDPDVSLAEVSSIISADPAIAAKIIKVANSSIYANRRLMTNLREALTILGINAVLTIALSFSLFKSLRENEIKECNHKMFWKRSIIAAQISQIIGAKLSVSNLEELFLISLLQDIGVLVIESVDHSFYAQFDRDCISHNERILVELSEFGVDHAEIGAWLLKSWGFSEQSVQAVCWSHSLNPELLVKSEDRQSFYATLSIAGNIADIWLVEDAEPLLESTFEAAQLILGLGELDFKELIDKVNVELDTMSTLFEIDLLDEIQRGQMLDDARQLVLERSIHCIKTSEEANRQVETMTEQAKKTEKENQLDHLTRVYNRKYIDHALFEEYDKSNINQWPLSLAFIDIDNFKQVNDEYGHLAGDQVLIEIASFFNTNIRQTDTIARYGGDEFILLLPGATEIVGKNMLSRLVTEIGTTLTISHENDTFKVTVSIGLATHMDIYDFATLKDFVRAADNALYQSKDAGRNCLTVYSKNAR